MYSDLQCIKIFSTGARSLGQTKILVFSSQVVWCETFVTLAFRVAIVYYCHIKSLSSNMGKTELKGAFWCKIHLTRFYKRFTILGFCQDLLSNEHFKQNMHRREHSFIVIYGLWCSFRHLMLVIHSYPCKFDASHKNNRENCLHLLEMQRDASKGQYSAQRE